MGSLLPNPEGIDNQRWAWQKRAACNGAPEQDQYAFTAPPTASTTRELVKQYCDTCPVLAECYAWARGDEYMTGVAGGRAWTSAERDAQTRQRVERDRASRVAAAEAEYEEWAA